MRWISVAVSQPLLGDAFVGIIFDETNGYADGLQQKRTGAVKQW
jgi:hypothetical protein